MQEGICEHTEQESHARQLEIHATGSKAAPSMGPEMVKHLHLQKRDGCLLPSTSECSTGLGKLLPCNAGTNPKQLA